MNKLVSCSSVNPGQLTGGGEGGGGGRRRGGGVGDAGQTDRYQPKLNTGKVGKAYKSHRQTNLILTLSLAGGQ